MRIDRVFKVSAAAAMAAALAACSGGFRSLPPAANGGTGLPMVGASRAGAPGMVTPNASKVTVTPASLTILSSGTISAQTVKVAETSYTGTFTETNTCGGRATASPTSGKGPSLSVKITGVSSVSCSFTFTDSAKNAAVLPVTVTTMFFRLTAASISPNSKSITIALTSVNGKPPPTNIQKTITATLPSSCSSLCQLVGPQAPPGTDVFSLTIFDAAGGTGKVLAVGSISVAVAVAKANVASPILGKVPKTVTIGTVPSANAGTPFSAAVTLPLTVADADGKTIVGTYSTPVKVTDSDVSLINQGSSLVANGGAASRSASLTASTNTLKLNYLGLAMAPVSLAASATGATGSTKPFAPLTQPIVNSAPAGPLASHEVDLYNPNTGQTGNAGTVTFTQPGWQGGGFAYFFKYALGGTSNNCTSYAVSPATNTNHVYTVTAAANAVVGKCTMTVTGGGTGSNSTTTVLLTYSTTGIGIGLRHAPHL